MLGLEDIPEDIKSSRSFSVVPGVAVDTFPPYFWLFVSPLIPEPTYDSVAYHTAREGIWKQKQQQTNYRSYIGVACSISGVEQENAVD